MQNTCTFGDARGPPALLSYKLQQQKQITKSFGNELNNQFVVWRDAKIFDYLKKKKKVS